MHSSGTGLRFNVSSLWEFRAGWQTQRRLRGKEGISIILNSQTHGEIRRPAWVEATLYWIPHTWHPLGLCKGVLGPIRGDEVYKRGEHQAKSTNPTWSGHGG